jgi:hypothetical protein
MSNLPALRAEIVDSLKGDKARERNTIFESGLVERLEKEGVVKLHQEVVGRIIASFGSGS